MAHMVNYDKMWARKANRGMKTLSKASKTVATGVKLAIGTNKKSKQANYVKQDYQTYTPTQSKLNIPTEWCVFLYTFFILCIVVFVLTELLFIFDCDSSKIIKTVISIFSIYFVISITTIVLVKRKNKK